MKLLIALFCLLPVNDLTENDYTKRIASKRNYSSEVMMPDGTRCDLVSTEQAIEVEWSYKWKEAPAQSILYSIWTGKEPKIILLVKNLDQKSKTDLLRCKLVCQKLDIDLEIIKISDLRDNNE